MNVETKISLTWIVVAAGSLAFHHPAWAEDGQGGSDAAVVARVNGESITRAEHQRMLNNPLTRRQLQQELGAKDADDDAVARFAVRKLVHLRLLTQEARRRNITVAEPELDAAITSLRRRFEDLKSFGEWMKEQGLDEESLFESVRADVAADRVWTALAEGARVSDQDVRQYYDAQKEHLRREEVRLQVITVKEKAVAEEVMAVLRKGEDFGRVARQRSIGLRATRGGDLGWVASSTLGSPLRDAVATLKPGHAVGPLQRGDEFLVVRLDARRPGATLTLAQARPEIERRLLPARRQEAVRRWLTEQESVSKVEMFNEELVSHARRGD